MELQELIARGRFAFAGAQERLKVFESVNGRISAKMLAQKLSRRDTSVLHDLQTLRDFELIRPRQDNDGLVMKVDGSVVYEKTPLARQIPIAYFRDSKKAARQVHRTLVSRRAKTAPRTRPLSVPSENEVLDICKRGEDEIYEFKGPGSETRDLTKEIAASIHTAQGGVIFYGVEDDGTIVGSDFSRQKLDQALQNSIRNTVKPAATVRLHSVQTLGVPIIVIVVPPWNRKDVYYYEGRVYIRKGTNVFVATPDEIKKLHRGEYVV